MRKAGLADLGRHATLEPAGAHEKDGARDSIASEVQPAVGGRGFKLLWSELRGQRSDSARVASGQTPKKPEEQAGARRKSTKRPRVLEDQWVTGTRVRSWARSQCRRKGPWRGQGAKMFLNRMERLSLRREWAAWKGMLRLVDR